jgi:hypothetical protein
VKIREEGTEFAKLARLECSAAAGSELDAPVGN